MKNGELFVVIIKQPSALSSTELLGRSICEHVEQNFANLPHATYDCEKLAVFPDGYAYYAVIYADMPLVTEKTLSDAIDFMKRKRAKKLAFSKGYVFESGQKPDVSAKYTLKTDDFLSVTDTTTRAIVYNKLKARIASVHVARGVVIADTASVEIDDTAILEAGAVIEPFVRICGSTTVKSGAVVGAFSTVRDSLIMEGAEVRQSVIENSVVGRGAKIGPFAYLRQNTRIGDNARIGDFVEIKNSTLSDGVKAAHLAYVGDAEIGAKTNVGCGTVFCNYDGREKHKTVVGDNVFIGANTNLIAPLTVGSDAFIAAGTTVTDDVQNGEFCIGRVRQQQKKKKDM